MADYERLYKQEMDRQYWERHDREMREHDEYLERQRQREEQRRQDAYDAVHSANTWREAFRKNIARLKNEHSFSEDDREEFGNDGFWLRQVRINKDAEEYMQQEMNLIQPIIRKLKGMISKLERRARQRAYKRIVETYGDNVDTENIQCIVDGHPEDLLWW